MPGAAVKHQVDSEAIEHRDDAEGELPAEDAAGMGEALDGGGHKERTCLSGGDGECTGAARWSGEGSPKRSGGAALTGAEPVPPQWRKAEKSTHRGGCSDACRAVGPIGSPYREPTEDLHGQRFHFVSCALF